MQVRLSLFHIQSLVMVNLTRKLQIMKIALDLAEDMVRQTKIATFVEKLTKYLFCHLCRIQNG